MASAVGCAHHVHLLRMWSLSCAHPCPAHRAGQREVPGVDRSPSSPLARAANLEATVGFLCETGVQLPDCALTGGRGSSG